MINSTSAKIFIEKSTERKTKKRWEHDVALEEKKKVVTLRLGLKTRVANPSYRRKGGICKSDRWIKAEGGGGPIPCSGGWSSGKPGISLCRWAFKRVGSGALDKQLLGCEETKTEGGIDAPRGILTGTMSCPVLNGKQVPWGWSTKTWVDKNAAAPHLPGVEGRRNYG